MNGVEAPDERYAKRVQTLHVRNGENCGTITCEFSNKMQLHTGHANEGCEKEVRMEVGATSLSTSEGRVMTAQSGD